MYTKMYFDILILCGNTRTRMIKTHVFFDFTDFQVQFTLGNAYSEQEDYDRCVCLFKQFKNNSNTSRMNAVCSVLECALHSSGVLCLLFLLYVFFRLRTD